MLLDDIGGEAVSGHRRIAQARALQASSKIGGVKTVASAGGVDDVDRFGNIDALIRSDEAAVRAAFHPYFATDPLQGGRKLRWPFGRAKVRLDRYRLPDTSLRCRTSNRSAPAPALPRHATGRGGNWDRTRSCRQKFVPPAPVSAEAPLGHVTSPRP